MAHPAAVKDTAAGHTIAPHLALRSATSDAHERVDAAFGTCDFGEKSSYTVFLVAHARILPPIEAALRDEPYLPAFQPRTPALARDLAALGRMMPAPMPVAHPTSQASAWGMLYVIEGSRLGGAMLARRVPPHLPRSYLGAVHLRGGWRELLAELDAAGHDGGSDWLVGAIAGARLAFSLYDKAAGLIGAEAHSNTDSSSA